jgi:RimJ/RimL family protein N-acetyltransferase
MKIDAAGLEMAGIRLEPLGPAHRAALAASGASEAMWNWMPVIGAGTSFDAYFDHVLTEARAGLVLPFAVITQADAAFAGVAAYLDVSRTHRRLRIGYQWHPEPLRGGPVPVATALLLIRRAREARIRRIEFLISEQNIRAIRPVERMGAQREGLLRNYMRAAHGGWVNMALYALVDAEIETAITRLEARLAALQPA